MSEKLKLSLSMVLVCLFTNILFAAEDPNNIIVPFVVSLSQAEAENNLNDIGLEIGIVTYANNSIFPKGHIITQDPVAGNTVSPGTGINVLISIGPKPIVPDLSGLSLTEVQLTLDELGLVVGEITYINSNYYPFNIVISQSPIMGDTVSTGSIVDLVVSLGGFPIVPEILGLPLDEAKAALLAARLSVGNIDIELNEIVPIGHIISTDPNSGDELENDASVNLVVSAGPNPLSGSGTEMDPFLIEDMTDIEYFSDPNFAEVYWTKGVYTSLAADFDFTGIDYSNSLFGTSNYPYNGIFNGLGHSISNLNILDSSENLIGLFGIIESQAVVQNIALIDCNFIGKRVISGICARNNYGAIKNCYVTGNISGERYIAGICAQNNRGIIENCYSTAIIADTEISGGIISYSTNVKNIVNCFWDTEVSGVTTSSGGTGLTTDAMKNISTYLNAGWDFYENDGNSAVWFMPKGEYPVFASKISADAKIVMPDLFNLTLPEAIKILENLELELGDISEKYTLEVTPGNVCNYSPLNGAVVAKDSIVDIALAASLPGTGSESNPYKIENIEHFNVFISDPNYWDNGIHTKLNSDIILDPEYVYDRAPIAGNYYFLDGLNDIIGCDAFSGVFNGNGHVIHNLNVNSEYYSGLFGCIDITGVVCNLGISNTNIAGNSFIGAIAGNNDGTVIGCFTSGSINAINYAGGLFGYNNGFVTACYSDCSVGAEYCVGGIAGINQRFISECYSSGTIDGIDYFEGLVGYNYGAVIDSFWDIESSGISDGEYGTGLTTLQMKDVDTYLTSGWFISDTDNVLSDWYIVPGDYPRLSWQFSVLLLSEIQSVTLYKHDTKTITIDFMDYSTPASDWTVSGYEDVDWITSISPQSGISDNLLDQKQLTITFDSSTLDEGRYQGYLYINTENNQACMLPVSLEVLPTTDIDDLSILAKHWLESDCSDPNSACFEYDWNIDGQIDMLDFSMLAEHWLAQKVKPWPLLESFNNGLPTDNWTYNSTNNGRIQIVNNSLRMDSRSGNSLNEAIVTLSLEGMAGFVLSFWQNESDDENDTLPATFTGSMDGDGVSISSDGVNWITILNADNMDVGTNGKTYTIDLDQFDVPYTSSFQIKFQQYDDYGWSTDGRQWDNIKVIKKPDVKINHKLLIWPLDETFGTIAYEAMESQLNGTVYGDPNWVEGKINNCLEFDGIDDYVSIDDSSRLNFGPDEDFSISCWFKTNITDLKSRLVYKAGHGDITGYKGYSIMLIDGILSFRIWSNSPSLDSIYVDSGSLRYDDNSWHNVVAVRNAGSSLDLYVDGNLINSLDISNLGTLDLSNNNPLCIGAHSLEPTEYYYTGLIDDVRLYKSALSDTDIQQLNSIPLVGYWSMDTSSDTTVSDITPFANDGTIHGNPVLVPGKINNCLEFDGIDDYISIPYGKDPLVRPFSAFAWVKGGGVIDSNNPSRVILCQKDGSGTGRVWIQVDDDKKLGTVLTGSVLESDTEWDSNNWHHVGIVWDGHRRYIYCDGILVASDDEDIIDLEIGNGDLLIGAHKTQTYRNWDGLIDDVRIYNSALSLAEIQQLAQTPLVGHWPMDESSGTSVADSTSFANNGTIYGNPSWVSGKIGNCLDFDGNDYVSLPKVLDVTQPFSIYTWVKLENSHGYRSQVIFQQEDDTTGGIGYQLMFRSGPDNPLGSNKLICYLGGQFLASDDPVFTIPGQWHHVGMVYDGISLYQYIDGVQTGQAVNIIPEYCNGNFRIGAHKYNEYQNYGDWVNGDSYSSDTPYWDIHSPWNGLIDDVRIYNSALSPADIMQPDPMPVEGHWSMDESSGTIVSDSTSFANDGTFYGDPCWVQGKIGNCLDFDGNDYVSLPKVLDVTQPFSIFTWVKLETANGYGTQAIFQQEDDTSGGMGRQLMCRSGTNYSYGPNRFVCSVRAGQNVVSDEEIFLVPGQWHHVGMVFDGTTLYQYIDGVQTGYKSGVTPAYSDGNFRIGAQKYNENQSYGDLFTDGAYSDDTPCWDIWAPWDGLIDDVRIYNSALSASDVFHLYQIPLIGHWAMDEGSGTSVADSTAYSNDGTIYGNPSWTYGKIKNCLDFDGNDYVSLPKVLDVTQPFTITTWVNLESTNGYSLQSIFQQVDDTNGGIGRSLIFRTGSENSQGADLLCCRLGSTYLFSNVAIFSNLNKWYHIAMVFDGTTIYQYIDGVLTGQASGVIPEYSDGNFRIGAHKYNEDQKWGDLFNHDTYSADTRCWDIWAPWDGLIDDVRIYNTALSSSEIGNLAQITN